MICAFFSEGMYHADEHYQLLEFISYKHFSSPGQELPWEYHKMIRPWFQPWLYIQFIKVFEFMGIDNRFFFVDFFRFLSGLVNSIGILFLCSFALKIFTSDRQKNWAIALLNLLWFLPVISVRTSAESLGTGFELIAIGLFLQSFFNGRKEKKYESILAGFFFGVAFLIRFHLAFMTFFICLWALIYKKKSILSLSIVTLVTFLIIGMGSLIDYWGYGQWVFTPWNFFYENIMTGYAANISSAPWWRYIYEIQKEVYPGLGLLVIISFGFMWCKYYKHPLTWLTLPFFVIHSLIGHKELRYIFSLAPFTGFAIVFFAVWVKGRFHKGWAEKVAYGVFFFNILILLSSIWKPMHLGVDFYKFLEKYGQPKNLKYLSVYKPHQVIGSNMSYYGLGKLQAEKVENLSALKELSNFHVFSTSGKDYLALKKWHNCVELYPKFSQIYHFMLFRNKEYKKDVYALFKCR